MEKNKVSVVLVGTAGYGNIYLKELLHKENQQIDLIGVVDILPHQSKFYSELIARKIPIYHTLQQFYQEHKADLAIISTPIHLHQEHSCMAMNYGSNVLCEKPIAIDPQQIQEMRKTSKKTGKFLAVGFNWSFTPSVQLLKEDIIAKKFGKAKRFKSITLWPRSKDYYTRAPWAGKKYSANGHLIYDSIASNATAHYLHHLLYLNGQSINESALLRNLTAELYTVNDIETFDTCAVKIKTKSNVEIYYYASHAVEEVVNPQFVLEFEHATISYQQDGESSDITVLWDNGNITTYEDPSLHPMAKLDVCAQAIIRNDHDILCGIDAATSHVEAVHAMHQSVPNPSIFPNKIIGVNEPSNLLFVEKLNDVFMECYDKWCLPSDLDIDWSKRGKDVKL